MTVVREKFQTFEHEEKHIEVKVLPWEKYSTRRIVYIDYQWNVSLWRLIEFEDVDHKNCSN